MTRLEMLLRCYLDGLVYRPTKAELRVVRDLDDVL